MPKSWCTTYLPTERHMQVEKGSIHRSFHQTFNVIDSFFFEKIFPKGKLFLFATYLGTEHDSQALTLIMQVCCRKTASFKTN